MLILPAITTTRNARWRDKIEEAKKLGLTEAALFVSAIPREERLELYERLRETKIASIPFVHLRSDMDPDEVQHLIDRYGVRAMNIHSQKEYPLANDLSRFKGMIYLENTTHSITDEADQWAGLCLDTSHLENNRLGLHYDFLFAEIIGLMENQPVGAWHLNVIEPQPHISDYSGLPSRARHYFTDLIDFDYCLRYKKYLPQHCIALELENPLAEQLKAKEHIEKLLS